MVGHSTEDVDPFLPDTVSPAQYLETVRRKTHLEADQELMLAVLRFGKVPHLGLRLSALVLEAGFGRVEQTASYENFGTREGIRYVADLFSRRFSQPEFVDRVINRGLTDRRSVEEMLANLKVWREHPASSFSLTWCEAVGWKE